MNRDKKLIRKLTDWFARAARPLPWRQHRSGYSGLVSEAMLQQTQVSRVLQRYEAFLRRFPTVQALADADEQEVLAMWQGLGYYRRARNLHKAAKLIVAEYGGDVPGDAAALQRLPGIGRYTAGAIASIIFNRHEPIVDGNVRRVLARVDAQEQAVEPLTRWAWGRAEQLVQAAEDPGAFNEGLMELGATVCTPRSPGCHQCPLASLCVAHRHGRAEEIPAVAVGPIKQLQHHHAVVIARGGRVLIEQRAANGIWASMWQVPTVEADRPLRPALIRQRLAFELTSMARVDCFQHTLSHRTILFHVFSGRTRARSGIWQTDTSLHDLPMSSAQRRVLAIAQKVSA